MTAPKLDGRVERGDQTRRAILDRAAAIASVEGLEGVSIGRLATELEVSKSGVFAHFGSKEELQLATVRWAREVFIAAVITPAHRSPAGYGGCGGCATRGSTTQPVVSFPAAASSPR